MNKYTEHDIKKKLNQIAGLNPSSDSAQRVSKNIRNYIGTQTADKARPTHNRIFAFAASIAAAIALLAGALYFVHLRPPIQPPVVSVEVQPDFSVAKLNAVFTRGDIKALDQYLKTANKKTQSRPDSLSLNDLINEL